MVNAYGATECGGISANPMPPGLRKIDSVGVSSGPGIAIVDESGHPISGHPMEPGTRGEIAVRGPGVFEGYETPDGVDRSTFVDGWHRTGDEGYLDADGYLFLTGRIREVIDRGGQKISPAEVEAVLRRHPQVRDAAVFAIGHEIHGQEVAALVAGRDGMIDVHDVRTFAAAKLAWFKVPRVVLAVTDIPLTPTGKVPRARLASLFEREIAAAAHSGRAPYEPPHTLIESAIATTWAALLKVERVGVNDRFSDLGGDSLAAVTMLADVSRKLGCEIPVTELWRSPTVSSVARFVEGQSTSRPSLLFPANPAGSLPPLYCVLPGYFPEVEDLSHCLGPDQPVYAMIPDPRPAGAQHGKSPEEIVGECVTVIRGVQPHGPYYLLGRSIGGIVAVEIALKLRAAGEPVAFVGMIDTGYPAIAPDGRLPKPLRWIGQLAGELIALPRERWRSHLLNLPLRALGRWARLRKGPSDKLRAALAMNTGLKEVFIMPPARFDGRITLFAAEESEHRGFRDRRLYWGKAAAEGLELHLLPGTHNLMSQGPLLAGFAETLRGCIERARHRTADTTES
jgi:oxalate---CoA ligase